MDKQIEKDWAERMELAVRRCSEVIDFDITPVTKSTVVRCKAALSELYELNELHKDLLAKQKVELINRVEEMVGKMRKEILVVTDDGDGYEINQEYISDEDEGFNTCIDEIKGKLKEL